MQHGPTRHVPRRRELPLRWSLPAISALLFLACGGDALSDPAPPGGSGGGTGNVWADAVTTDPGGPPSDAGGSPTDGATPADAGPFLDTPADVTDDAAEPADLTTADGATLDTLWPAPDATSDTPTCSPDCVNKQCGPDGCGGLCGICLVGEQCNNIQQCGPDCTPACDGKFCGPDGCGGSCGACPGGFECGSDGKCYDVVCVPDCAGKVCGDDGCQGSCGDCVNGDLCTEGACAAGPCSGIPEHGLCDGQVATQCVDGAAVAEDCAALADMMCGWSPDVGHYACIPGTACIPSCTGKQCGSDGCGGACGTCPTGWPCEANQCAPAAGGACGWYTAVGQCNQNTLWYCGDGTLFVLDCGATSKTCQFDPSAAANSCQ